MRECGECTACCTILQVQELSKPAFSPCVHLRAPSGCSVYDARPPSCRGFECLWLKGRLPAGGELRPDRLGLMFSPVTVADVAGRSAEAVAAWEVWPGAAEVPAARAFLLGLSSHPVVLIRDDHSPQVAGELVVLGRGKRPAA